MGSRRTGVVLVALIVGAIAGLAAYQYLTTVQERANKNAKLVKVFVVKHDIPKGTPGENALDEGWIRPGEINVRFRPATALPDISVVRGKVALTDLAANQVAVVGQFVDPIVTRVTSAERIPTGKVAITLAFDEVTGVAGLIQPGDRVNMLILHQNQERHLLQNVSVLFVGGTAAPQPGESQPTAREGEVPRPGLLTFALSPENALRVAYANFRGERAIHLTLVPGDNEPVPVRGIDDGNLIADPVQVG